MSPAVILGLLIAVGSVIKESLDSEDNDCSC